MQGEFRVCAAEVRDEMVFERVDGTFGRIVAVDLRGYELEVDCFLDHVVFEELGALIVESLELWLEACFDKGGMGTFVGGEMLGGCSILHWLGVDGIAIKVV
jgi:hypothetical protein